MGLIKRMLAGAALVSALSFGSCTKYIEGPTGPGNDNPSTTTPATPSITQVQPNIQEPNRWMYIRISDNSKNETGFRLERRVSGGSFSLVNTLPQNSSLYEDLNIEPATQYTYRIQAYNQSGNSPWSPEVSAMSANLQTNQILLYPVADSFVMENDPNINFGHWDRLMVADAGALGKEESYLKFPYNDIPSYARGIDSAELRLVSMDLAGTMLIFVEDLATSWSENAVTWNSRPVGRGVSADNSYTYNNSQPVTWDVTSILRNYLVNGFNNNGMMLRTGLGSTGISGFSSKEGGNKPSLTVNYNW
jgi:hypothetical protein